MGLLFRLNIQISGEHVNKITFLVLTILDPYQWVGLSIAQRPFSDEIVNKVLPLVDNTDFVRELGNDLRKIFEVFLDSKISF